MSKKVWKLWVGLAVFASSVLVAPTVLADAPQSSHYRFDEGTVGTSGYLNASSQNYQSTSAAGDLGVGNSASTGYQIEAGSKTTSDPTLSFSITNGAINFGSFSPSVAATANVGFSVSNYSSYGYIVQLVGTPPTSSSGGHTIAPLASTDSSRPGVEQFGANLVANTSPISFGANPDNGQFGFGSATANYSTSNQFRFVSGETIAQSVKSSGLTNYTLSYIVNVNSLTPGGTYASKQTLLITGTF
jgi:hypothetical protein